MGTLINRKFLIKKAMIMMAGLCSVIGIILNSVAMGTDFWIVANGGNQNGTNPNSNSFISVNYGLFRGEKTVKGKLGETLYSLTVFCPSGEGICLVSCGTNDDELRAEFDYLRFHEAEFVCSGRARGRSLLTMGNGNLDRQGVTSVPITEDNQFMKYDLWITTLIFLSLTLATQIISAGLCIFNTATVPIETFVGPMGIYLTNTVGGLTGLITLSLWGDLYSSNLRNELAIQETILDTYRMTSTNLGFSYWFVFVSLLLSIASCVCVRFRNSLKKFSNKEGVRDENLAPGGMLF